MRTDLRYTTYCLSLSIAACLSLSACGIKGPLYIPEKQYPQSTDKKTPAPRIPSEKQPRDDVVP
ncbi:MAG: lipoprotein [Methylophilaceae bacterium]